MERSTWEGTETSCQEPTLTCQAYEPPHKWMFQPIKLLHDCSLTDTLLQPHETESQLPSSWIPNPQHL